MREIVTLSGDAFDQMKPLNGQIIVYPEQDVENIVVGGQKLFFDGTWKPENNQRVLNRVIKVPDAENYSTAEFISEILVSPGDLVWVNYYQIMHATEIRVVDKDKDGVKVYLSVCYRHCFMSLSEAGEDVGVPYTYQMLNDYVMLKPAIIEETSPLVPDTLRKKESKLFYQIERLPFPGSYDYKKELFPPIEAYPGQIAYLFDENQFKLEHPPHYVYDNSVHYVTRIQKIMAIVDEAMY